MAYAQTIPARPGPDEAFTPRLTTGFTRAVRQHMQPLKDRTASLTEYFCVEYIYDLTVSGPGAPTWMPIPDWEFERIARATRQGVHQALDRPLTLGWIERRRSAQDRRTWEYRVNPENFVNGPERSYRKLPKWEDQPNRQRSAQAAALHSEPVAGLETPVCLSDAPVADPRPKEMQTGVSISGDSSLPTAQPECTDSAHCPFYLSHLQAAKKLEEAVSSLSAGVNGSSSAPAKLPDDGRNAAATQTQTPPTPKPAGGLPILQKNGGVLSREQYRRERQSATDRLRKDALTRGTRQTAAAELRDLLQSKIDRVPNSDDSGMDISGDDHSCKAESNSTATGTVFDEINAIGRVIQSFPKVDPCDPSDQATCAKIARIVQGESLMFFHWIVANRKERLGSVRSLGLLCSWADDYAKYRGFHS